MESHHVDRAGQDVVVSFGRFHDQWCNDTVTGQQALYYWKKNDVINSQILKKKEGVIGGGQPINSSSSDQSYYTYSLIIPQRVLCLDPLSLSLLPLLLLPNILCNTTTYPHHQNTTIKHIPIYDMERKESERRTSSPQCCRIYWWYYFFSPDRQ